MACRVPVLTVFTDRIDSGSHTALLAVLFKLLEQTVLITDGMVKIEATFDVSYCPH